MPVRDLLKNIRLSQGGPPLEAQVLASLSDGTATFLGFDRGFDDRKHASKYAFISFISFFFL